MYVLATEELRAVNVQQIHDVLFCLVEEYGLLNEFIHNERSKSDLDHVVYVGATKEFGAVDVQKVHVVCFRLYLWLTKIAYFQ